MLESGNAQFFFSSPLTSFGTNVDYPVVTMAIYGTPQRQRAEKRCRSHWTA